MPVDNEACVDSVDLFVVTNTTTPTGQARFTDGIMGLGPAKKWGSKAIPFFENLNN